MAPVKNRNFLNMQKSMLRNGLKRFGRVLKRRKPNNVSFDEFNMSGIEISPANQHISAFRDEIETFNAAQSNRNLLDAIRKYNNSMIDEMNSIRQLKGTLILDIGASPHGYALIRAMERGAALYIGIGLDIDECRYVVGSSGNAGMLLKMDGTSLQFPDNFFDEIISISTFEHLSDVDAAIMEIARVLKPGGLSLISFEPVWTCSYGHHLHHFGECAKLLSPWSHLIYSPDQLKEILLDKWPADAPLTLDQAIEWIYFGNNINRKNISQFIDAFNSCSLDILWLVRINEESIDRELLYKASRLTGFSPEDLSAKGLSVLMNKRV